MEVNVAISIKVETLFRGANVFREGDGKLHEGEEIIPPGEGKYFLLPGDFVTGETLFRDTGSPH